MMAGVVSGKAKVQWVKMGVGALLGAASTVLFLVAMEKAQLDLDDPSTMLAIIAGLSYALMGLAVAFGIFAPSAGARYLNVEDADELREQKRNLLPSAIVCLLIGLFLLLLAAGPAVSARVGRETSAILAAALLAAAVLIAFSSRTRTDELMRQIGVEASAWTYRIVSIALALWAVLVQFTGAAWVSPVALVAGLSLLELAAIFAVSAKRGLMSPR